MKKLLSYAIIIVAFLVLICVRSSSGNELSKIVIDTDAGADDAVAILLLLLSENDERMSNHEVVAITCSYGNTNEDNVEQNVLKILTVAGKSHIPVYRGATKSLLGDFHADNFFGEDGFGEFNFTEKITAKIDTSKHAASALVDLVKESPGEISLLTLGPLTNLGTAIALEPSFIKLLKNLVIMGSTVNGYGMVRPNVEFNFSHDPESNFMVFNCTKQRLLHLIPYEILTSFPSLDWRLNVFGKLNNSIVDFLNKAERISLSKASSNFWNTFDTMAAIYMLWPEIATKTTTTNVQAITCGQSRGGVLVDFLNKTKRPKNTVIVQEMDAELVQQKMLEYFSQAE